MGLDDGRTNFAAGASVVDADTRVYGTDNVFVVDGSIMPGLMTGNPAAMMVIMAEQAAARMLASPPPLPAAAGQQCGGNAWKGPFLCRSPHVCTFKSDSSSVCV